VTTGIRRGKWTVADDKVYAIRARGSRSVVVEIGEGGSERVVYDVPLNLSDASIVNAITVSRKREIFLQYQNRLDSDLMIVENFR
jgi:hypothetical protein